MGPLMCKVVNWCDTKKFVSSSPVAVNTFYIELKVFKYSDFYYFVSEMSNRITSKYYFPTAKNDEVRQFVSA